MLGPEGKKKKIMIDMDTLELEKKRTLALDGELPSFVPPHGNRKKK